MTTLLNTAIVQMAAGDDLEANLAKIERLLQQLSQAEMVVLPEMWSFLVPDARGEERYDFALRHHDRIFETVQLWAKKTKAIWIAGTIFKPDHKTHKVKNTCYVIAPDGKVLSHYDKLHLFDNKLNQRQFSESNSVVQGSFAEPIVLNSFKLGLGICYDLRFPYHFQALSEAGANVIALPSAFNFKTGQAHWEVLLRARAIENQAYVLACNQTNSCVEGVHCWGHSMVIDPWGTVIARLDAQEAVLFAEIDAANIDSIRTKMPVLEHRLIKIEAGPYQLDHETDSR